MQEKFLTVQNAEKSGIPGEKRRRRCRMQAQRCILPKAGGHGARKNSAAVFTAAEFGFEELWKAYSLRAFSVSQ